MAFEPGQRVSEYEILSVLGTGGMGRVYRVRNVISDRIEAMKVLLPDFAAEPDLAARFIAEIRTLASLDHPNIAQLHTACQIDNQLVMMMEFVEGFTLEQRAGQGPIPQGEVVEYALQILAALSYAHGRGVVHRDIKPANAMVTSHGIVKLMDFGIAKSSTEMQLTRPGTTIGSLYYMSPEQVRGGAVDARSDLYSLGILLYELLAGRRPFDADTTYGVLNQQLNSLPTPPAEVNPQLPKPLNDLILFSLAKDPAQRFQSAEAFRNALNSVMGRPVATTTAGTAGAANAATAPKLSDPAKLSTEGAAAPPFAPVSAPPAAPQTQQRGSAGSQRAVWITIGALTVIAVLMGAAIGLPHFLRTSATSGSQTAAPPPTSTGPAQEPQAAAPASNPTPAPDSAPAAAVPSGIRVTRVPETASPHAKRRSGGGMPHAANPAAAPVTAVNPNPAPATATAPAGPSPQEFRQAEDRKTQLEARVEAVSASLDNLRRQQEADGLGLRQDMTAAAARMRGYMQAATGDLGSGDIAAAQRDMDRAEKEIATLEAFFNR